MSRPKSKEPKERVHVTLDKEVMDVLISYCDDTGLSISYVVNTVLKNIMFNSKTHNK